MSDGVDARVDLRHGDCLSVMAEMVAQGVQVDAVVTDPPYGIGFMGRSWDAPENVAFRPETWRLALDLLKPGGHMFAFGGTRTYHRMVCAIEDAGFEIRDQFAWVYGSGFPKSLDISKQIDKRGGVSVAWFGPWLRAERERRGVTQKELAQHFPSKTGGLTGCVANWELGFNLPTPEQFNTLCRIMGLPFDALEEAERAIIGTRHDGGGRNVAILGTEPKDYAITVPATDAAKQWQGWGTAVKPSHEPIVLARKPLIGTVAENVLAHGTGALNIDGCRVDAEANRPWRQPSGCGVALSGSVDGSPRNPIEDRSHLGRFPANLVHDGSEEVLEAFARFGERPSTEARSRGKSYASAAESDGNLFGHRKQGPLYSDTGTAARFFYCAKASKADRAGSRHHTVKPVSLIRWLVRMITPPGGVVLDPFAGSGTTGEAALLEGKRAVLIEREAEYVEDIRRRLDAHYDKRQVGLFEQMGGAHERE